MAEIILRFQKLAADADFNAPVPVTVEFEGAQTAAFEFINRLTDKDLSEIRWYLEQYTQWPSDIDRERARTVEGSLPRWGRLLFEAIFEKEAGRLFERFDGRRGENNTLVIDTSEPRILRLPWELLSDKSGYLFSKRPQVTVVRRMQTLVATQALEFEPPVRILLVTCRPDGAGFIDPRSIATPLLGALEDVPEQVEVEFLRPPTLTALDQRLRDPHLPRVHIVHFDGHGVYDKGVGLGFLLFEDEEHQRHMVDAEQLGALLNESGIPLMVLNACQSAQPDDKNPFASVASRLIESGVGGVVAMNYSVLVETAKRFTAEFYSALGRGLSASAAMDAARRRLFSDTKRITFTRPREEKEQVIHLQDWFLPALYQQADELIPFKPDGKSIAPTRKATIPQQSKSERGGFPPSPLHGFHGRARELLDLERAFAGRNIVVLHGFGGQGKTSLATQAAEWFTRTHLFERAAFLSFETGASFDFVLNELGNALVEENFQIHQGDKVEAIAQSLREKPALVVFDNFESALPGGNAPMQELQALLEAASKWFAPPANHPASVTHSALLITTRNAEIPHPAFAPSQNCLRRELEGLAASDALELAASILEAHSLPRPPRVPLEELLKFLKGHPLSLQLALPQLRDHSAEQLVAEYQSILPQMKAGEARERNESLEVSLKFSLDRLGKDAVNLLARLVIFEDGAWEPLLLNVTEIPEDEWNKLKPQLTSTALVRLEDIPNLTVPFVHFHPTLVPYIRAYLQPDQSLISNLQERYWQAYYQFARELYQTDTQQPYIARALATRELPNLKRALKLTLFAGALKEANWLATYINRFLDAFGRWRERDEIASEVEKATKNQVGGITPEGFVAEHQRGTRLLQSGQASVAQEVFQDLLTRLETDAAYDARYDQSLTLQFVGRCLGAQGRPSQASDYYRRAIGLAEKLEQTDNNKLMGSKIHTDLGDVLLEIGQYEEARKEYEISLAIKKKVGGDERGEGAVISNLGRLALEQSDLNEARKYYLEALSLFQRMGEDQSEAIILKQLGMVEAKAKQWEKADEFYKMAIPIQESIGDFPELSKTCNQLAMVAENAGRPQEAERWYLRAIELGEKLGDRQGLAKRLNNLANLYLAQNRLVEAEAYARRALAIMETLDLSAQPWATYSILAQLAEKRGRMDEVHAWRRKEQESFAAFAGSDQRIQQWQQEIVIIVAACQGDEEAIEVAKQIIEQYSDDKSWGKLANAMQRVLNGERGDEVYDGLDREDALVIRRILQALNGDNSQAPSPQPSPTRGGSDEQGVTLPQLLEFVERAAGGDKELGGQLFTAFQQMARAGDPLGNVLLRVLVGERNPDLAGLPDEAASAVRGMLGRLKNQ